MMTLKRMYVIAARINNKWSLIVRNFFLGVIFFCRILFFLAITNSTIAQENSDICGLPVKWDYVYGDDENHYGAMAFDVSNNGKDIVAVGWLEKAEVHESLRSLWIWKIDEGGQLKKKFLIDQFFSLKKNEINSIYVVDIRLVAGKIVLLINVGGKDQYFLVLDDAGGKNVFLKVNEMIVGHNVYLSKIIDFTDNVLTLVGRADEKSAIFTSDLTGKLKIKNSYDIKNDKDIAADCTQVFVDGSYSSKDGTTILLGECAEYDRHVSEFFPKQSSISLVKLSERGDVLNITSFAGRYSSMSSFISENYLMAYDKANSQSQDVNVSVFDKSARVSSERSIQKSAIGFANKFYVAPNDNDFIVAGTTGKELLVTRVNKRGDEIGKYIGRGKNQSRRTMGLRWSDEYIYLLTKIPSETVNKKPNFKVGLIKVKKS